MKHPSIDKLALYAGGELSWWTQWTLRRHIGGCGQCQHEVALFQEASAEAFEEAGQMPAGVQWERLAAEMRANVRLGLEASDAISAYAAPLDAPPVRGMSWRTAAVATCLLMLLSVGYWLGAVRKSEQLAAARGPEAVVLEASERAVGLSDGNKGMELQGPRRNQGAAIVTVSTEGSAGAQYVDEETGQITVNHVYVE
ncbi:MAG TPA: hypothetical protein VFQ91_27820 [Bryobacteraceae bacterium]|nr:hypothetical protein [Bryobacteraceae bacterium]